MGRANTLIEELFNSKPPAEESASNVDEQLESAGANDVMAVPLPVPAAASDGEGYVLPTDSIGSSPINAQDLC